jgi:hypothetical protein
MSRALGGRVVPYVTAWSTEARLPCRLVEVPGRGIGYADESLADRDDRGVLWVRMPWRPGQGRPMFGMEHAVRQRRAMRRLLCQVCAGPADRTEDGVLWLVRDYREDWPDWPERMSITEPPVCLPCAALSLRVCPALRGRAAAFRARQYAMSGVRGAVYAGGRVPRLLGDAMVGFDDSAIRWVRASGLLRDLHDCTMVDLDELEAEAACRG